MQHFTNIWFFSFKPILKESKTKFSVLTFLFCVNNTHCMKSFCIRRYSGPYFAEPSIRTRKSPNTDTFHKMTSQIFKWYPNIQQIFIYNAKHFRTRFEEILRWGFINLFTDKSLKLGHKKFSCLTED